jgi:hypothetical protein
MPVPDLIAADLNYGSRFENKASQILEPILQDKNIKVLSIRGDLRDYSAARKFFPRSTIKMNGWVPFLAKRSVLVDFPFSMGWLPVRSRYRAWASLVGVEWLKIEQFYRQKQPLPKACSITIHVGAQWRSKQYPHAAELAELLRRTYSVQIIAGPNDPLPEDVAEKDVNRLVNSDLARALASSTYVVSNDSGPMHAAALLRCRTLVVTNHAAMKEWLPPTVVAIESDPCPGYRPRMYRPSDAGFVDWPSAAILAERLQTEFLRMK